MPSSRNLSRRFGNMMRQQQFARGEVIAWVGRIESDGVTITVNVPDTSNQVYVRINGDVNQTHPAFKNNDATGVTPTSNMVVVVRLLRGEYHIVRQYTFTP